jgi:hypothetical protein
MLKSVGKLPNYSAVLSGLISHYMPLDIGGIESEISGGCAKRAGQNLKHGPTKR